MSCGAPTTSAVRIVVAAAMGIVVGGVLSSWAWWATHVPDLSLAEQVMAPVVDTTTIESVEHTQLDGTGFGATVLFTTFDDLDWDEMVNRAQELGWIPATTANGAAALDAEIVGRAVRLSHSYGGIVVDPHRSPWPGVVQLAGIGLGAIVSVWWARRRTVLESPAQAARRRIIAWGAAVPMVVTAIGAVAIVIVRFAERPDVTGVVFSTVVFGWWLLVPLGVLLAWFVKSRPMTHPG